MLKSKSVLFATLVLATQFAAAGGLVLEKQVTPPFDQQLQGSLMLEKQVDNGGLVVEGIMVPYRKTAGVIVPDRKGSNSAVEDQTDNGGLVIEKSPVLERGGIKLLSGGLIIDRHVAGGMIVDQHLAGGLIIDRHGRNA